MLQLIIPAYHMNKTLKACRELSQPNDLPSIANARAEGT